MINYLIAVRFNTEIIIKLYSNYKTIIFIYKWAGMLLFINFVSIYKRQEIQLI